MRRRDLRTDDEGMPIGTRVVEAPDTLTVEEAAALLRVGRRAMYDAIGRNQVPHRRLGKQIRLSRAALREWLARRA